MDFWGTLLMRRVARACPREGVARRATEDGTVTDSRSPLLLGQPQGVESEYPRECRGLLGGRNKHSRPNNRGRMTVRLCGIGPWASPYTITST